MSELVSEHPEELLKHTRYCQFCDQKRRQAVDRELAKMPAERRERIIRGAQLIARYISRGDFDVEKKARKLVEEIDQVPDAFPQEDLYGLTNHMRRSSSSIAANVEKGSRRDSDAEVAGFVQLALGAASELEHHLLLARDLHFLENADYKRLAELVTEMNRTLTSFSEKLRADCERKRQESNIHEVIQTADDETMSELIPMWSWLRLWHAGTCRSCDQKFRQAREREPAKGAQH